MVRSRSGSRRVRTSPGLKKASASRLIAFPSDEMHDPSTENQPGKPCIVIWKANEPFGAASTATFPYETMSGLCISGWGSRVWIKVEKKSSASVPSRPEGEIAVVEVMVVEDQEGPGRLAFLFLVLD
jgi:hypothetical protein